MARQALLPSRTVTGCLACSRQTNAAGIFFSIFLNPVYLGNLFSVIVSAAINGFWYYISAWIIGTQDTAVKNCLILEKMHFFYSFEMLTCTHALLRWLGQHMNPSSLYCGSPTVQDNFYSKKKKTNKSAKVCLCNSQISHFQAVISQGTNPLPPLRELELFANSIRMKHLQILQVKSTPAWSWFSCFFGTPPLTL